MRVVLTSAATADFIDVLNWYDARAQGLGPRFLDEFEALVARVAENPRSYPIVRDQTRRAGFRRFPYSLFFRLQGDEIQVFACLHASRDPRRWQERS